MERSDRKSQKGISIAAFIFKQTYTKDRGSRKKIFENKSKPNEMHDEGLGGKKTNSTRLKK